MTHDMGGMGKRFGKVGIGDIESSRGELRRRK